MDIKPIAHINTPFKEKFGIPRQSARVEEITGRIVFAPKYRDINALREIESFSHIWLIFDFSLSHREGWSPTVRPPRLGGNRQVGVFASRSPFRPNSLGLSCVRLLSVSVDENDGPVLTVAGVDLLDGTPIYDIKPYLPSADCHIDAVGGYADAENDHKLSVSVRDGVRNKIPADLLPVVINCIADDPRPSYQNDPERIYKMRIFEYDVSFKACDNEAVIIDVE